jgi:alpha-beta hydrolase superfamily lysophospholipase
MVQRRGRGDPPRRFVYAQGVAPDGPPRGSVVVSPGRSEPIEKYFEVVQDLLDRGFVVLVHDWRGQGCRIAPCRTG